MFSIGDSIDYYRWESVWGCRSGISCLERWVGHGPGDGTLVLSIHSRICSSRARRISSCSPLSRSGFCYHDIALGPRRVRCLPTDVLHGAALVPPTNRIGLFDCIYLLLDTSRRIGWVRWHSPCGALARGYPGPVWNELLQAVSD